MESVIDHKHNGTDSRKLKVKECFDGVPQAAVSQVSGTAGASYTATEQEMINANKTAINDLIVRLQAIGLII